MVKFTFQIKFTMEFSLDSGVLRASLFNALQIFVSIGTSTWALL